MTPEHAAAATASAVSGLSSKFMFDAATYAAGAELGFAGIDFYFAGRGGVLGDVDADVVAAGFVFFNPTTVRAGWAASHGVMTRHEAAAAFADCAMAWATAHLGDDVDWARLASLAGTIASAASPAAAPVFAGWRALPVPQDPKHAAMHQMNALRELRNARHGVAVVSCGIPVGDAVRHRSALMTGIFGWDDGPIPDAVAAQWEEAEALTDHLLGLDYAALDERERTELVDLADAAMASIV
ncbi:MAG: SCO6745 family protein [Acidimicrobiales bacterium]